MGQPLTAALFPHTEPRRPLQLGRLARTSSLPGRSATSQRQSCRHRRQPSTDRGHDSRRGGTDRARHHLRRSLPTRRCGPVPGDGSASAAKHHARHQQPAWPHPGRQEPPHRHRPPRRTGARLDRRRLACHQVTASFRRDWAPVGSPPLSESWNDRQRPVPVCNNRAVPDAGLDPAVMERFRTGDDDAVRTLYRHYGRLVFTIAVRILGNRQLAEDATQQAFLQAWRAASTFESGKDPAPWLATIARRVAIDMQRREVRRPATSLEECQRRRSCPGHPSPICGGSVGDLAGPRCDRFAATRRARGRTAATHRGPQPERDRAATRSCHRDGEVAVVSRSSAPGDASQISPRTARQWLTY